MLSSEKPKLVFFQWDHAKLPGFAQLHMRLHAKCLAQFFDVTVINNDCDYLEICDRYKPDLSLFEAGVNYVGSRRPTILNTSANHSIPKLGLHNGDGWCEARAGFVSDMDRWGVETFFTISTTTAEHSPELADRMYIWPNFVDGELYKDYGASKIIPVLITGKTDALYPWRQRVHRILTKHYPALVCPHQGYWRESASRTLSGEQYARAINASYFVPTCGTVAHEFLRKHVEIPASGSCLVTEGSQALSFAGFESMKNCVFADAQDILEKLDHLLSNPEELSAITAAGNELVHSRHTMKQRDQIFQWFTLRKLCGARERIVQLDPFGALSRVAHAPAEAAVQVRGRGAHLEALSQGDQALLLGKLDEAEMLYRCCLGYSPAMPEPRVRLAWCCLARGEAAIALDWLRRPIEYTLDTYLAVDPDPVEWAYFIIAVLCTGDVKSAEHHAGRFPHLRHPELDRARWVLDVIQPGRGRVFITSGSPLGARVRPSIHRVVHLGFADWVDGVARALSACGQHNHAKTVRHASTSVLSNPADDSLSMKCKTIGPSRGIVDLHTADRDSGQARFPKELNVRDARTKLRAIVRAAASQVLAQLRRVEHRFGYFLPYRFSALRQDPLVRAIQTIIWDEEVRTVLVLGAQSGTAATEAVLAAQFRGVHRVRLLNKPTPAYKSLKHRCKGDSLVECVELSDRAEPVHHNRQTCQDFASAEVDLAVMESPDVASSRTFELLATAHFVVLGRTKPAPVFDDYQRLLALRNHRLLEQDGDYAVFGRFELNRRAN